MADFSSSSEINAVRERLLKAAISYDSSLRGRPGLLGVLLYGSLGRGELTIFSDIDLALFYEDEEPRRTEHRLFKGEKVDTIAFPLSDVTKLLDPLPRSLDAGFPFSYVLESLLLAGDDSILYDPTGELLRVKTRLNEQVSFASLNLVSASDGYRQYYQVNREKASVLLTQGEIAGAMDKAHWSGRALAYLLRGYALAKETRTAADRLGIPEFADREEELAGIFAPSSEAEAIWSATQSLWDYTIQAAAEPVRERLRASGVAEPDTLELTGDYGLFWPGDRINEFGRVMGEVALSLRWCRYELDHGKGAAALERLWGCRGTAGVRKRWETLSAALKGSGYDCSDIIDPMLEDTEFIRRGERLDSAMAQDRKEATPKTVQRGLALTDEMERILRTAIPFLSQEALAAAKG